MSECIDWWIDYCVWSIGWCLLYAKGGGMQSRLGVYTDYWEWWGLNRFAESESGSKFECIQNEWGNVLLSHHAIHAGRRSHRYKHIHV